MRQDVDRLLHRLRLLSVWAALPYLLLLLAANGLFSLDWRTPAAVATYVLVAIVKKELPTRCLALLVSTNPVGLGHRENPAFLRLAARSIPDRSDQRS